MKMHILTTFIAVACFSQAASAELTSGAITNQTTATADVVFNQPITLENTLTPVAGITTGRKAPNAGVTIATGQLAIKEVGVTAQLALKSEDVGQALFTAYAEGHQGDPAYELTYLPVFDQTDADKLDNITTSDGYYIVNSAERSQVTYKVLGAVGAGQDVMPPAGKYTISVTGAVYNP